MKDLYVIRIVLWELYDPDWLAENFSWKWVTGFIDRGLKLMSQSQS